MSDPLDVPRPVFPSYCPGMTEHAHGDPDAVEVRRVDPAEYDAASALLKALVAPMRLALVDLLSDAPRCVHELVGALDVPQPLVSQHLKVLRSAGLVATTRRGREVVYRLADEHVSHVVRDAVAHARET
jgi:ArsR family transcriptional regulator, zinc-responsive transcriptional repressor